MAMGILSKLYINNGGTYASPLWLEVSLIADLNMDGGWNKADSSVRAGRVETQENTNFRVELSGTLRKSMSDAGYVAMRNAFTQDTILDVLVLDGARTVDGSDGFRFEGKIGDFGEDQGLQSVVFKSFTLIPCAFGASFPPRAALVLGGVLTFQNIGT